ncbi:MAG TPA: serine/threonine-protein kinase, partial [Solirubrobacteraceae bacterium]|nr:serine/threonine-protein kinase [Solirubrobacteraceae bacterium]
MAVTDDVTRYRDIERLGVGGMATVTLAEDTMLRRRVALKRVHTSGDIKATSRLRREALVGASLSHPNLVAIYDVEIGADGDLVIVMEYVAGETLRDAIDRSGGLPPAFALEVLDGVAAALDAIHAREIVHRDVKPANILLGREGAVKLADLGIAVAADRTQITAVGVILGTFSYMAPEQLEGSPAAPAIDVYALAAVAFEMLSGQKARPEANPVALAHAISTRPPPDLCALVEHVPRAAGQVLARGMDADPARRPSSAGELVARLRAALGPPAETAPAPAPAPAPP